MVKAKYNIAYLMHGARNVGGGEYSIYFLIKGLRRDIFEPIVLYSYENEIIQKLKHEKIKLIKLSLSEKITSVYRDEINLNPFAIIFYTYHLFSAINQVVKALKMNQVNLLHPHDNLSKIIGGIAAKISGTGVKVVAHCRDLLKENLVEKMLLQYQLLMMDRIITVSETNRELFKKRGNKISLKIKTIYNGIDLKEFDSIKSLNEKGVELPKEKFLIGIIGVFDKCKGHIYLFKAIEKLIHTGTKNIICVVVGDGRDGEELKSFVINKNLGDYFLFLGYRKDIPEILKKVDVVVIPSVQESFPRISLEAMAMKVPVIASKVGGLPESIKNDSTGILVPPTDVDALSESIKYLIDNPEIRKNMGEAGKKRVETKFSLDENIKKTEELYLDVLKNI